VTHWQAVQAACHRDGPAAPAPAGTTQAHSLSGVPLRRRVQWLVGRRRPGPGRPGRPRDPASEGNIRVFYYSMTRGCQCRSVLTYYYYYYYFNRTQYQSTRPVYTTLALESSARVLVCIGATFKFKLSNWIVRRCRMTTVTQELLNPARERHAGAPSLRVRVHSVEH
jgi:hypothetical protein